MYSKVHRFMFLSTILTVTSGAGLTDSDLRRMITATVEQSLSCSDVPGLALSVVGNGRVLLERGYGVANLETGAPVTADTLFPLGSATKAFTTSLLALLIDKHARLPTRLIVSLLFRFLMSACIMLRYCHISAICLMTLTWHLLGICSNCIVIILLQTMHCNGCMRVTCMWPVISLQLK